MSEPTRPPDPAAPPAPAAPAAVDPPVGTTPYLLVMPATDGAPGACRGPDRRTSPAGRSR
ncbi:hypothetical protein [Micromonospora zhanjiangensis]